MRILSVLLITLVGCGSPEPNTQNNETQTVDSIIQQSERSFVSADSFGRKSDELINTKVTKAVNQITALKKEVTTLKAENHELKAKLDSLDDDTGKPFSLLPVSTDKDHR